MAPPSKSAPRPWRALSALAVIILVMLIAITGKDTFSPGSWHKDFKVALGLDLASGTQVTLKAQTFNHRPPQAGEMDQAVSIMEARVNGTGNSGAQVQKQGTDLINVSVPNAGSKQVLSLVDTTAQLWFRQVLLTAPYTGTTTPSPTPSTTPSGSPSSSSSPSPKASSSPSASASAKASTKAKVTGSGGAAQPLTTSAHAVASPSPSASAKASASPGASSSPAPLPTATTPSSASLTSGDASKVQPAVLKKFNQLVCKPSTNGNVNDSWKKQIGYTTANWDNENAQVVSCDAQGNKFVLDVAKVTGKEVTSAQAGLSQTSADWQVNLGFNGAGTKAFGDLTTLQFDKYYPQAQTNPTDATLDRIAIVLDGDVMSAPETQGAIVGGNAQIFGNFTQEQATSLANVLKYGALPLTFDVQNSTTVSAQLASSSLDAGLIAAAIGLGLVVVYSFLYYRGLGLVSVSSLVIAGLLSWLAVILLSKYNGFAMELSGIAGLIVAIGITADSFVVFFERLRDEVREGRALRPAVESGWRRARRTILVSDTVSFLAAVLLYYFAIGEVKGFAYTLGLTTVIDVLVVFLFTHPMVTVLARTNFYGRGHKMSGLDPERLGARAPWRSSLPRTVRTRTATASRTRTSSTPEEA